LGSEEEMDTTACDVWIPEAGWPYASDAMVHATGAWFDSGALEGGPAEVEYSQFMEDLSAPLQIIMTMRRHGDWHSKGGVQGSKRGESTTRRKPSRPPLSSSLR